MIKTKYKVYRVESYIQDAIEVKRTRSYVGDTYAVSPEKACCNVEYRLYGKSLYGGGYSMDFGSESGVDITFEAEAVT